jgi:hypothetical protein
MERGWDTFAGVTAARAAYQAMPSTWFSVPTMYFHTR